MQRSNIRTLSMGAGFLLVAAAPQFAHAITITLADQNSIALFSPDTQAGQFSWTVDGTNQIAQQWFWYRIGNAPEQSIDAISPPVVNVLAPNIFESTYVNAAVQLKTTYMLSGGMLGSGSSDLAETIRITNLTNAPLDFHFFQYVNFDLNGTPLGESAYFANSNSVVQTDGASVLTETVLTTLGAASTHREVNIVPNTINSLNDGGPTTLNDNLGPVGPGDVSWAFQWDFTIPAFGTRTISKDKNLLVPEPATMALLGLGSLVMMRRRPV